MNHYKSKMRIVSFAALLSISIISSAQAQTLELTHILDDPTPGSAGSLYANDAVISGNYALIGDFLDDTFGSNAGQSHLFDVSTGNLLHTFNDPTPTPITFGDRFGNSIAIDGTDILIGDHLDDSNGRNAGQAHLFDAVTGNLLRTFNDPTPTNSAVFGNRVAIDGNSILISTIGDGPFDSGQVHLFDKNTGDLLHTFDDPSPTAGNSFGHSIAVGNNKVLVSDPFDNTNEELAGQSHLFDAATGNLLRTFNAPNPKANDKFGVLGAYLHGTRALINSDAGQPSYVFDTATGDLLQSFELNVDNLLEFAANQPDRRAILFHSMSSDSGNFLRGFGVNGVAHLYKIIPAPNSPVLDQESFGPTSLSPAFSTRVGSGNFFDNAQTFEVGISGALTQMDLYLERDEQTALPLLLDIRLVNPDGSPTEADQGINILGSLEIPASEVGLVGDWVEVDLSALGIVVEAGQQLALSLQSDEDLGAATREYVWFGSREGTYAEGGAYNRTSGAWEESELQGNPGTHDLYFRTFVQPIPEPNTLALILLGYGIAVSRRF